MIWIVFALLTGAAVLSVLWPLSRPAPKPREDAADITFYRAQIAEIDAERERGAIDRDQAEAAKAEAARRLLASAPQETSPKETSGQQAAQTSAPRNRKLAAALALVAIPLVALGLYNRVGNPDQPDMPLEARLKDMPNRGDFAAAIAKMEAHLAAHPEDGKAQELMAPVWQRMGRFQEAIAAREAALKALGDTPERRIRLAEAFAAAENGEITPQAQEQIERALELDPKWPEARYFLGLAAAQKGDVEKARALWRALAADLPEGESARAAVEEKIAELDGPQGPSSPQSPSAPQDQASPQGQAAQAVAQMPPDQQQQTIRAMVERLNDRLAEKGGTVEEWSRLIRAYKVLNEEAKARQTLANARKAYAADAPALETIDGQARDLGLDGK